MSKIDEASELADIAYRWIRQAEIMLDKASDLVEEAGDDDLLLRYTEAAATLADLWKSRPTR